MIGTLIMLGGAAIGGIAALGAASEREKYARRGFNRAENYLEAIKKRKNYTRDILAGNLSVAAMSANSANEEIAREASAASGAQANALGSNGLSGGTPFYKIDLDVIERRNAVIESNTANRQRMGSAYLEAVNTLSASSLEEMDARARLMDAGEQYDYAGSEFAYGTSILSGALQGAQVANGVMAAGVQSGLLTEDFLGADLFSSGQGFSTGQYESFANDMVNLGASEGLSTISQRYSYNFSSDRYANRMVNLGASEAMLRGNRYKSQPGAVSSFSYLPQPISLQSINESSLPAPWSMYPKMPGAGFGLNF